MNKLDFSFSHVKEVNYPNSKIIAIEFTLYQHTFYLSVIKPLKHRSYYKPLRVDHMFEDSCPHCQVDKKEYEECRVLSQSSVDLFHVLIEQPAIRLTWLYRDYE